jgi:Tol biopolymer transport system component
LYRASRPDRSSAFGAWELLPFNDPSADTTDATLDTDLVTLGFASLRTGGPGGYDLWSVSRPDPTGAFGAPSPIVSLDTMTNEDEPYLMGHQNQLWYNSVAQGTEDVYAASWNGSDFIGGGPVSQLNTPASETFPTPSADGLVVYFGSNRAGNMDIYLATRASTAASFAISPVVELASAEYDQPSWLSPDLCRLYFTRGNLSAPFDARAMVAERQP